MVAWFENTKPYKRLIQFNIFHASAVFKRRQKTENCDHFTRNLEEFASKSDIILHVMLLPYISSVTNNEGQLSSNSFALFLGGIWRNGEKSSYLIPHLHVTSLLEEVIKSEEYFETQAVSWPNFIFEKFGPHAFYIFIL